MAKQHARFSPSKLEGLGWCPKYERVPIDDSADEGTMLHDIMEKQVIVPADKRNLDGLSSEQKNAITLALGYADSLIATKPGAKVLTEARVEFGDLTWGTADLIVDQDTEADVLDYKFGRNEVTAAEDNLQVRTYCAAYMLMRPEVQRVRGHVCQPRVGAPNFATFDRTLVEQVRTQIEFIYQRAARPFSPPIPGGHCSNCVNAHECPALKPALIRLTETLSLPTPEVLRGEVAPTPEDRASLHSLAGLLETVAEQWKKNNSVFVLEQGGTIPGLAVRERGMSFVDRNRTAEAILKLRNTGYASEEQILGALKLSIPDLAKAMVEIRGGDEKDERARILETLGDCVRESSTKFLAKAGKGKKTDAKRLEADTPR